MHTVYASYHTRWDQCVLYYRLCALYSLYSHWISLHQIIPYLHKLKLFSTLLPHWTCPHLVSKGCYCLCHQKSAALTENKWSPVALLLWVALCAFNPRLLRQNTFSTLTYFGYRPSDHSESRIYNMNPQCIKRFLKRKTIKRHFTFSATQSWVISLRSVTILIKIAIVS